MVPASTKSMAQNFRSHFIEATSRRETLEVFPRLSTSEWRPRPLRPPPASKVTSAADAFGKGNCGGGGWLGLLSGHVVWFAHRFTVTDFTQLGLPMQSDANLDISSYETLAQCFVLLAFWKSHGSGRLALTLPALSDNSGAESVCNKLYTSKVLSRALSWIAATSRVQKTTMQTFSHGGMASQPYPRSFVLRIGSSFHLKSFGTSASTFLFFPQTPPFCFGTNRPNTL